MECLLLISIVFLPQKSLNYIFNTEYYLSKAWLVLHI